MQSANSNPCAARPKTVPTSAGLTVIGGNNGQGKTSVLDAIAWALGGDRYRPSAPPGTDL